MLKNLVATLALFTVLILTLILSIQPASADCTLRWTHPTTRESGAAFDAATEMKNYEVSFKVPGATTYTTKALIAPTSTSVRYQGDPGGTLYQLRAIDLNDRKSLPANGDKPCSFGPSAPGNFAVS